MKLLFIFLITTFLSVCNYSQETNKMEKVNSIIQTVKEKFAPDKRVAIFNIEAAESGDIIIIKGETNLPEAKSDFENIMKEAGLNFVMKLKCSHQKN